MNLPGDLNAAISAWMATHGRGSLAAQAQNLSATYRKGETSSHVSLAAYMATRVPATFAANEEVQVELQKSLANFAPTTLLDIGAGPGVATWAALATWPTLVKITQCEQDKNFAELAGTLNKASALLILTVADVIMKSEATLPSEVLADLVTASYVLAELPLEQMQQTVLRLWGRAKHVLVLIEPGTPQGFARLHVARDSLMGQGAFVLAPCTHQNTCPIAANDWCHFKTRVQRSREHMHAKGGTVPFEDEAFSYLIVSRQPALQSGARVVAPVTASKHDITMKLCSATGLQNEVIASRDKPTYKRAKKTAWGHVWE